MPVIAAQPTTIQNTALIGARPAPAAAPKVIDDKKASMAASLARTDMYVNSTAQVAETVILSLFNSYQDTQGAMARTKDGALVVTDFVNVGASVQRAAVQKTVTSTLNNGWQVFRGKVTLAEAGGRVVGDVASSAVANGAGAIATNLAVAGLAKVGAGSLPVMVGGMVAGFAANNISHRMMSKFGVTQAITNKTTQALQSLSGVSNN